MNNGEEIKWELTLTIGPARKILELIEVAWNEGQCAEVYDILRAIAWQHPCLIDEFDHIYKNRPHLSWPIKR